MMRIAAGLILFCSVAMSQNINKGFDHFYNFEFDQAITEFRGAVKASPKEAERHNYLARALLYREMLKSGMLESQLATGANPVRRSKLEVPPNVEEEFTAALQTAMELSQARIDQDPKDTRAVYALCISYGLRGNWNFLVRKAYFDALKDLTSSRKLGNQALELDPTFVDAKLIQGVHDYVVGSLPRYMRMLGFLGGVRGDREGGLKRIEEVAASGRMNEVDAKMLLGMIYRREKRPEAAIPLVQQLIRKFPRNYIFHLELAQMWADAGDGVKALAAVDSMENLLKKGINSNGALVQEKVDYARGNIQFWYREYDKALVNLHRAADHPGRMDLHTEAMAWLRIGQLHDVNRRRDKALQAYQRIEQIAPDSDVDKEAQKYRKRPFVRTD